MKQTRGTLFRRAVELAKGIQEIFDDAAHWNTNRKPGEPMVEVDPTGELLRLLEGLKITIEKEIEHNRQVHPAPLAVVPCNEAGTDFDYDTEDL